MLLCSELMMIDGHEEGAPHAVARYMRSVDFGHDAVEVVIRFLGSENPCGFSLPRNFAASVDREG